VTWITEGQAVCEGIEHEEALPVDAREKAKVLRSATDYFTEKAVAAQAGEAGRKAKQRAAGGGGPDPPPSN